MTKAIRNDPVSLYNQLKARQAELKAGILTAQAGRDLQSVDILSDKLIHVENALRKTVAKLNKIAAAIEDPVVADPGTVKPPAPAADDDEESPVAMPSKLRKEIGDMGADFLDDYSYGLYEAAHTYFTDLESKALTLGEEGEEGSLRSILREQIGKLGVARVETVFDEWRAATVKSMFKALTALFEQADTISAPGAAAAADEGGAEDEGDEVEEDADVDSEEDVEESDEEAAVEASVAPPELPIVASTVGLRVSAKVRDFRPAGSGSTKLT